MKNFLNKKISLLSIGMLLWQFLVLPIKSYALKYTPLENGVFNNFNTGVDQSSGQLGVFLGQAFQFGLALAAALSIIMIVWGGVKIMLTESVFEKDNGKEKIKNAIYGLLLALASWLILFIINPEILNFKL